MNPMNCPLFQSFVSPELCRLLSNAGINTDTPFVWKVQPDNTCLLFTLAFDVDSYYTNGQKHIEEFKPPTLPAYQCNDMEKLLPDYYYEKSAKRYSVLCSTWFPERHFEDTRLPDLFARIVHTALVQQKLHPFMAVEIINNKV